MDVVRSQCLFYVLVHYGEGNHVLLVIDDLHVLLQQICYPFFSACLLSNGTVVTLRPGSVFGLVNETKNDSVYCPALQDPCISQLYPVTDDLVLVHGEARSVLVSMKSGNCAVYNLNEFSSTQNCKTRGVVLMNLFGGLLWI